MQALKLALASSLLSLIIGVLIGQKIHEDKYFLNAPDFVVFVPHEDVKKQALRDIILTEYPEYNVSIIQADFIADNIILAEQMMGVPPNIMLALIATESSFIADAISNKSAVGYTQVVPSVWKDEIPYDLYDNAQNILAGAFVLRNYYLKLGNWDAALKAYNVGISDYKRGKKQKASKRYLTKIKFELKKIDVAMYSPKQKS